LGGQIGSKVKRSYLFPEESKANEAYLAGNGFVRGVKKERKQDPKPPICFFCGEPSPLGKEFCINPKCGMPLNPDKRLIEDKNRFISFTF
jgi:hypothetical protein